MRILQAAAKAASKGEACALVTIIGIAGSTPRSGGARMLVFLDGSIVGTVGGGAFEHKVIAEAQQAIAERKPRRYAVHLTRDLGMCCGGAMEAYIEPMQTTDHLVIYGAGHVGAATAAAAVAIGFEVTVVDNREDQIASERFPPNVNRLEKDPLTALEELPWGQSAYHLIVTHSHQLDQDLVSQLLPRPVAWLGMIGSRAKVAKFFVRLRAAGTDATLFQKLSAPVGLDIGAETPEEIAISILAELVRARRRHKKNPQPLSHEPIEARGGDGRAIAPIMQGE